MAKSNKKQEKAIIENLPVASTKWIKQPWNLTFVKGEMSLMQLRHACRQASGEDKQCAERKERVAF